MTLFGFGHAQKNAFAFVVGLSLCQVAVGLRRLDFRLPVASCGIDRLLMIFPLRGHPALKRKKCRLPHENCEFNDKRGLMPALPKLIRVSVAPLSRCTCKGSASRLLAKAGILPADVQMRDHGCQIELARCLAPHRE